MKRERNRVAILLRSVVCSVIFTKLDCTQIQVSMLISFGRKVTITIRSASDRWYFCGISFRRNVWTVALSEVDKR